MLFQQGYKSTKQLVNQKLIDNKIDKKEVFNILLPSTYRKHTYMIA